VAFNGFRFSAEASLGSNVSIMQLPGIPDQPGIPQPPHTEFTLYNLPGLADPAAPRDIVPSGWEALSIRLYRTADLAQVAFFQDQLLALQKLVLERPDLGAYMAVPSAEAITQNALPFLPVVPAGQVLRARAQYYQTSAVTGIVYVTTLRQDVAPTASGDLLYTFQGLSTDGQTYIALIARLKTGLFPDAPTMDPATFDVVKHLEDATATLNAAAPTDFAPALFTLDALVQSFAWEG
jgi:hypothetical protein